MAHIGLLNPMISGMISPKSPELMLRSLGKKPFLSALDPWLALDPVWLGGMLIRQQSHGCDHYAQDDDHYTVLNQMPSAH